MVDYNLSIKELSTLNSVGYHLGYLAESQEIEDVLNNGSLPNPLEMVIAIGRLFIGSDKILSKIDREIYERNFDGKTPKFLYGIFSYLWRIRASRLKIGRGLAMDDLDTALKIFSETKSL